MGSLGREDAILRTKTFIPDARIVLHGNLKMLYLIGLGLCDEKDITIRGLEVRKPHRREDWSLKIIIDY